MRIPARDDVPVAPPAGWLSQLWDDWLAPPCPVCARPGSRWCPTCRPSEAVGRAALTNGVPIAFRARYRGDWAVVLRAWKLGRRHDLTPALAVEGRAALVELEQMGAAGQLLVPVPPRSATLRRRGLDLLGRLVVEMAAAEPHLVAAPALHWRRQPQEQVGTGRQARQANLSGALIADESVAGRAVTVCDDITTTGATLSAATAALTAAGASSVAAFALGRVEQHEPAAPKRHGAG